MTLIIILVVVGFVAILAELVLPGGLLGIVGALCLIAAVIATFIEFGATAGIIGLIVLLVLALATLSWWMKYFHRLPGTKQLILHEESGNDGKKEEVDSLLRQTGITLTDLVPSGHARIDGKKYDVIAEAGSVSKGQDIIVVALRGPSLIVRVVDSAE